MYRRKETEMGKKPNKPKIGVVLTAEARKALKNEQIQLFLQKGRYFNCDSVSQEGFFLHMKLRFPDEEELVTEISIPIAYVLYMVSAEAQARLGFGEGN
jgi:hypothetical protein